MPETGRPAPGRRRPAVAGERRVRARQPGEPASPPAEPTAGGSAQPSTRGQVEPARRRVRANRTRRQRSGRGLLPAVVGVLLLTSIVLAAVTALFLARVHQRQQADTARTAALAAARASAVDLLSYDYHHLDADFAKAKSHLTGPFAQEYADTSSKVVQPTATEFQAVVTASVAAAAVKTASASSAVVLVFVNQTSQNTKVPAPHVDQNRVRLTMTKVHGQWLVSKLEAL